MKAAFRKMTSLALAVVILFGAIGVFGLTYASVAHAAGTEGDGTVKQINYVNTGSTTGITVGTADANGLIPYTVNGITGQYLKLWMENCTDKTDNSNYFPATDLLSGYDAFTYYLDTTYAEGEVKPDKLSLEFIFYYMDANNARQDCQPKSFWYVSDTGEVLHCEGVSTAPADFKGNVYVLFNDAPKNFAANVSNATYYVHQILTTGKSGATVKMGNARMISNGKALIQAAVNASVKNDIPVKVNAPTANEGETTYDSATGTVTNKGNNRWWKAWVTAPFHDVSNSEQKYTINLTGYDAYAFDIDLSNTTLGLDENGKQAKTLGVDTVFYTFLDGVRKSGRAAKLHLIDEDGKAVMDSTGNYFNGFKIPEKFKGTVYILLDEVTRDAEYTDSFAKHLDTASVVVNRVISTGTSETGVTFGMSNMKFIANGALTVAKAEAIAELDSFVAENRKLIDASLTGSSVNAIVADAKDSFEKAATAEQVNTALARAMASLKDIVDESGTISLFQKSFRMKQGAAIRMVEVDGKYAIIYQVSYDVAAYDAMVKCLAEKKMTGDFSFGMTITKDGKTTQIPVAGKDIKVENGTATFQVTVEVPKEEVGTEISARAYLQYGESGTIKAVQNCNSYSVAEVAQIALNRTDDRYNDDQKEELQKIVDLAK